VAELNKDIDQGKKEVEKRTLVVEDIKKRRAQLSEVRETLMSDRKWEFSICNCFSLVSNTHSFLLLFDLNFSSKLWAKETEVDKKVKNLRENLRTSESNLNGSVGKEVSGGIASIRAYVEQNKVPGVYGPLYELFDVDDTYITAVEATAGNRFELQKKQK